MSPPNDNGRRCPLCGKPKEAQFRPFCSKRCADLDLGRWLKGSYVVPGREVDEGDGAPTVPAQTPEEE
ncbi:MAG TPA: DNA gyrase inhibitor YacG [Rhizomicrobium sp.]|nr:DNA gyrase inhibitor YacG [Rhizomicrobium sp.]